MKEFSNLEEIAIKLGDCGPYNPDIEFDTVEELVNALVDLGNTDQVYVRHDDHLGLKLNLSDELLSSHITDANKKKFESEVEAILEQANIIIPLSERDLSDEDYEEIQDDRLYRGKGLDD